MRLKVLLGLLVLCPCVLVAQTPTWKLSWDQPNTLTAAQGFQYTLKVDSASPVPVVATCVAGTPVKCSTPLPTLAQGQAHTLILTATSASGSANSAPLGDNPPGTPTNLTIIVNVTIP